MHPELTDHVHLWRVADISTCVSCRIHVVLARFFKIWLESLVRFNTRERTSYDKISQISWTINEIVCSHEQAEQRIGVTEMTLKFNSTNSISDHISRGFWDFEVLL